MTLQQSGYGELLYITLRINTSCQNIIPSKYAASQTSLPPSSPFTLKVFFFYEQNSS